MTTYYVDSAATGTADGLSEANAWTTIDTAMNNVVAGDKVWVKASGTYSETPNMDTAGTAASPIVFEGYGTTTGDNEKVTISGTTNCLTGSLGSTYYIYKNFIFSGASSHGVSMTTSDYCSWINCEFNSNGSDGINADRDHLFVNCVMHSNTSSGVDMNNNARFIGCIAYGNGATQLKADSGVAAYKNVMYATPTNIKALTLNACAFVAANTIDGENTALTGIDIYQEADAIVVDNIIYDCQTGVDYGTTIQPMTFIGYNLINSNTTNYDVSGENIGYQDVTDAPSFTDEAGDDYTVDSSSPAIAAGLTPGGIT